MSRSVTADQVSLVLETDRTFRRVLTVLLSLYVCLILFLRSRGELPLPEIPLPPEEPPRIARLLVEPQKTAPAPEPIVVAPEVETAAAPPSVRPEPPPAPPKTTPKTATAKTEKSGGAPSKIPDGTASSAEPAPRERVKQVGLLGLLGKGKGSTSSLKGFSALKELPSIPSTGTPVPETILSDRSNEEIDAVRNRVLADEQARLARLSSEGSGQERSRIAADPAGATSTGALAESGLSQSGAVRTSREISAVVRRNREKLLEVYNLFLKKRPNLQGSLTLEFIVSEEGRVLECRTLASFVNDPAFEEAIIREVLGWKFSPIEGGTTTILYPISFSPAG
jgi:TonB family protein